ncbi:MAG: substrate-binding domain-containing protein [Desulfobacteraceae bacterium]|nr:substrate-binding domain-containing protein [Desulfobacteraceae bacterium]
MKKVYSIIMVCVMILAVSIITPGKTLLAGEEIRYACSSQIYKAFEDERLSAFIKKTRIKVNSHVCSSSSALKLLMNGYSDVAATAEELYYRHKEYGYVAIPFCKDPLAIITSAKNPIKNISEEQLQGIFGGKIANWQELGGPDKRIIVVLPGKNTAAYRNFKRTAMRRKEVIFDLMSYESTLVIETIKRFPWSISFIAQGAAWEKGIKMLMVDGLTPMDPDYPYYQVFSFVTKGKPTGPVKKFIDHALSKEGRKLMEKKGMIPYSKVR